MFPPDTKANNHVDIAIDQIEVYFGRYRPVFFHKLVRSPQPQQKVSFATVQFDTRGNVQAPRLGRMNEKGTTSSQFPSSAVYSAIPPHPNVSLILCS